MTAEPQRAFIEMGRNGDRGKLHRRTTAILVALMIAGLCLILYPSVSDYWNSFHQTRAVMTYAEDVAQMDRAEYDRLLDDARAYNRRLADAGILWEMTDARLAEYDKELSVSAAGSMGCLVIDKIGVMLPVYHGTDEPALQSGAGHLEGTSLPVGCASFDSREGRVTDPEEGSHCVISGHRGLPSARLLTDLDKLEEGDTFTLHVLDEVLTYEVDQIRTVLPTDVSDIRITRGEDLCTLVTCTPYGVNTHRLLVRGRRAANPQGDVRVIADALQIRPMYIVPFQTVPLLLLTLIMTALLRPRPRARGAHISRSAHRPPV